MLFRITLAALALAGLFCTSSVSAQAPQAPAKRQTSVAVIDIGYLIRNHPRMASDMESIKAEMAKAQEDIEERRQKLVKDSEGISNTLDSNSPQFKQAQEALINQESKLRVDFMGKEKEFAEKQATVIYRAYQEITGVVERVVTHYQYDVVIRYSREQDEMDPKKPATVNNGVQRDVIYHHRDIDITDFVLTVMKQEIQAAAPPVAPNKGPGPIISPPLARGANGAQNSQNPRR